MNGRPAAFLDRDGTIMRDVGYARDPGDVELLPGAADAIRRLNERGVAVIVVTNQSGIARGLSTVDEYHAVQDRMERLLTDQGACVAATYLCPHHPDFGTPCDCRKPGTALFRQAIQDHGIDASRSVFIGDRWRDVAPASVLGGLGIMVDVTVARRTTTAGARATGVDTAPSLDVAVDRYLATLPV